MSVVVSHLNKSYGKHMALADVSFTLNDGDVVGLLGENGAGKSTLMKILTGILREDSGQVKVPQGVGYLPEQNPLYTEMYVREYLLFIARLHRYTGKQQHILVEDMIERVGLREMANKHIGELSKGYKQRVGIAAALLGEPQLLVLDEPTTGLDPNQLDEIREVIRNTAISRSDDHQAKRIVILSTHILQEVKAICNRVIILKRGVIKCDTTTLDNVEQLFRDATL